MFHQAQNSVGVHVLECIRYENFRFVAHMHRHHELLLVRKGSIRATVNGRSEPITAGEYAYVPSNAVHAYESIGASTVDVCVFSDDLIPAFGKELRKRTPDRIGFTCRPTVKALADEVLFVPDKSFDLYTRKGALYAVSLLPRRDAAFVLTSPPRPSCRLAGNRVPRYKPLIHPAVA
jgi:hypothetical protein